jgi:UPF0755 protein
MDEHKKPSWRYRSSSSTNTWASPDESPKSHQATRLIVVGAFVAFVAVVCVLLAMAVGWFNAHSPADSSGSASQSDSRVVTVQEGMTAGQIGAQLENQGIIASSAAFLDLVAERRSENKLQPGEYEFPEDIELIEVVNMLEQGLSSARNKVRIPEGLAISQIVARLDSEGLISGTDYDTLAKQLAAYQLPSLGGEQLSGVSTMEGLLFPATYFLFEGEGANELIAKQLAAFTTNTSDLPWQNAEALGVTRYQIVIIASMIEKEVRVAAERPMVARVIYNRLAQSWTLGIDATIRYALNKWTDPLTDADLAVDSPYNTRLVRGLPPAPICNPGVDALRAALEPVEGAWMWYVLADSTTGSHTFCVTEQEFNAAVQRMPAQ